MEFQNPSIGEQRSTELDAHGNGDCLVSPLSPSSGEDYFDSACSTPFVSAPSSPSRGTSVAGGFFYSAPSSPMHYILCSSPLSPGSSPPSRVSPATSASSFEFEFSARFPATTDTASAAGPMTSADELFLNGQIRSMKLSSHLERPQAFAPLLDLSAEADDETRGKLDWAEAGLVRGRDLKLRSRSIRRKARSLSPLRNALFFEDIEGRDREEAMKDPDHKQTETEIEKATPSALASASRSSSSSSTSSSSSSSSGRSSKRWIFLKDLLHRSKSEGRATTSGKEKFWHTLFSAYRERSKTPPPSSLAPVPSSPISIPEKGMATTPSMWISTSGVGRPLNGVGRRRRSGPSPHERHYTVNRARAEEMRRRTYMPYRQGLLGCLGFSSRSYGAINGLARSLNPVSYG